MKRDFKIGDEVVLKSTWSYVNIFKIKSIEKNNMCWFAEFTNGYSAKLNAIRHTTLDDDWRRSFGSD